MDNCSSVTAENNRGVEEPVANDWITIDPHNRYRYQLNAAINDRHYWLDRRDHPTHGICAISSLVASTQKM
jgi:hypothetical protein